mgnify:CR=1 FL=1
MSGLMCSFTHRSKAFPAAGLGMYSRGRWGAKARAACAVAAHLLGARSEAATAAAQGLGQGAAGQRGGEHRDVSPGLADPAQAMGQYHRAHAGQGDGHGADLLVLGSPHRLGVPFGSHTVNHVLKHAGCPVVLVPARA